jgi:hypothetical protein
MSWTFRQLAQLAGESVAHLRYLAARDRIPPDLRVRGRQRFGEGQAHRLMIAVGTWKRAGRPRKQEKKQEVKS